MADGRRVQGILTVDDVLLRHQVEQVGGIVQDRGFAAEHAQGRLGHLLVSARLRDVWCDEACICLLPRLVNDRFPWPDERRDGGQKSFQLPLCLLRLLAEVGLDVISDLQVRLLRVGDETSLIGGLEVVKRQQGLKSILELITSQRQHEGANSLLNLWILHMRHVQDRLELTGLADELFSLADRLNHPVQHLDGFETYLSLLHAAELDQLKL